MATSHREPNGTISSHTGPVSAGWPMCDPPLKWSRSIALPCAGLNSGSSRTTHSIGPQQVTGQRAGIEAWVALVSDNWSLSLLGHPSRRRAERRWHNLERQS